MLHACMFGSIRGPVASKPQLIDLLYPPACALQDQQAATPVAVLPGQAVKLLERMVQQNTLREEILDFKVQPAGGLPGLSQLGLMFRCCLPVALHLRHPLTVTTASAISLLRFPLLSGHPCPPCPSPRTLPRTPSFAYPCPYSTGTTLPTP